MSCVTYTLRHLYKEKQAETSHHAAAWFIGLETAVSSLESMPQRGVATPEDRSLHHLLYGKKPHIYRIIYSIDEQLRRVDIAQIRHGAREPLPKSRMTLSVPRSEREKVMATLQEKLKSLPAARRKKIDRRTAQLVSEEMTMRELRKARNITQAKLAETLNIKQEQVSRIEKRTDLHIATLRRQVEALGGDLTILATFPNGAQIKIMGLGELEP